MGALRGLPYSSVLAKGVDPLKYKMALEDLKYGRTDEQALEDLLFNYQVKFDDYDHHEPQIGDRSQPWGCRAESIDSDC